MRNHIEILNEIKSGYIADYNECADCNNCSDKSLCFDLSAIQALDAAIKTLEQESTAEPIIRCKDCKHWHEWENGTGDCHRSNSIWIGTDYDDYCSFAERRAEQ